MAPAADSEAGGGCPVKGSSSSGNASNEVCHDSLLPLPCAAHLFPYTTPLPHTHTPLLQSSATPTSSTNAGFFSGLGGWFGRGKPTAGGNDTDPKSSSTSSSSSGGCPVKGSPPPPSNINPLNNERLYSQSPQAAQAVPLSTSRQVSSIPKSDFTPKHQPKWVEDKWVYPSEQQYFNAMKSKGFKPLPQDVHIILAIHNAVNEQGWNQLLEWEKAYSPTPSPNPPKLKRFMGRPQDLSPKAALLWITGQANRPFDRHDWVVERENGEEVRYVIDFYTGQTDPKDPKPVSMHLDVRPALDSGDALKMRVGKVVDEWKEEWLGKEGGKEGVFSSWLAAATAIVGGEGKKEGGAIAGVSGDTRAATK